MKRVLAIMLSAAVVAAMGAQELTFGTMEGTMRYAPVVAKVLKEAGFAVKAKGYPTQQALLKALGKGEIDGAFFVPQPVIQTVPGAVMIPVKLGETRFCALTTDPKIKITKTADLKNYKVGIVKDHSGHMAVTRGLPVVEAPGDFEQFKLLTGGQVQVIVVLEEIVPVLSKPAGLKDYFMSIPLLRTPNFLALSAANAGAEGKIESALKQWVDSKQWEQEMAKTDAVPEKN